MVRCFTTIGDTVTSKVHLLPSASLPFLPHLAHFERRIENIFCLNSYLEPNLRHQDSFLQENRILFHATSSRELRKARLRHKSHGMLSQSIFFLFLMSERWFNIWSNPRNGKNALFVLQILIILGQINCLKLPFHSAVRWDHASL